MYSFCNNAPTLLPTGRQHGRCIVAKIFIYNQSAPEDGQNYRPKYVEKVYND
jgi:hypothetical protein